jgi:uncharacterized protein YrzB (UPF0473 family)
MQELLESGSFTLESEGEKIVYTTILTYDDEKRKKSYVLYTDNTLDEDGDINMYAATYDPNSTKFELNPVETDEEWDEIQEVYDERFGEVF